MATSKTAAAAVECVLQGLELEFHIPHSIVYEYHRQHKVLIPLGWRGFVDELPSAPVGIGTGAVGLALLRKNTVNLQQPKNADWRRAVDDETVAHRLEVRDSVSLPGLQNIQSVIAVPILHKDHVLGILAAGSDIKGAFGRRLEFALEILAVQLGPYLSEGNAIIDSESWGDPSQGVAAGNDVPAITAGVDGSSQAVATDADTKPLVTKIKYHESDDSIFVNNVYVTKGLPGRILYWFIQKYQHNSPEVSLRELRREVHLQSPNGKDNLDSRLIFLRKRLSEKNVSMQISSIGRGRFRLEAESPIEIE